MQLRILIWLLVVPGFAIASVADAARSSPGATEKKCAAIDRRLEKVQSRLRAGYSVKQGRKLKTRRRELEKQRFRQCR